MTDRTDTDAPFRDAEAFLAELGVERRPIVVRGDSEDGRDAPGAAGDGHAPATLAEAAAPLTGGPGDTTLAAGEPRSDTAGAESTPDTAAADRRTPVSATEAARLASETVPPDEVSTALAYVRRSTAAQPASEGRLRSRLADRGHDPKVIEAAMAAARAERLVDDDALSAALVAEWRAKGHAPRRLRVDLRRRGFDEDVVDRAVGEVDVEDHTAAAFSLACHRAESLGHLPPEKAARRVAGYVARRGYGEGLARKAARDAVYAQRQPDRVAGH